MRNQPPLVGLHQEQGGAVAVMVAVFVALAVLAAAAVTIDLGSMWSTQRQVATGTDGAALAAAVVLKDEIGTTLDDCVPVDRASSRPSHPVLRQMWDEASEVVAANGSDQLESIRVYCGEEAVKIEVQAQKASSSSFGPAVGGATDPTISGATTAEFRVVTTTDEVPQPPPKAPGVFGSLAFCENFIPTDPSEWGGTDGLRVRYKQQGGGSDACEGVKETGSGNLPGNWGWLSSVDSCDHTQLGWCSGRPGNSGAQHYFNDWLASEHYIGYYLFSEAKGQGANSQYRIAGWVEATLIGCEGGGGHNGCNGNPDAIILEIKSSSQTPYDPDEAPTEKKTETAVSDVVICEVAGGNQCLDEGW